MIANTEIVADLDRRRREELELEHRRWGLPDAAQAAEDAQSAQADLAAAEAVCAEARDAVAAAREAEGKCAAAIEAGTLQLSELKQQLADAQASELAAAHRA